MFPHFRSPLFVSFSPFSPSPVLSLSSPPVFHPHLQSRETFGRSILPLLPGVHCGHLLVWPLALLQETLQNSNRPLKIPVALLVPGELKETAAYADASSHQEAGFGRGVRSRAPPMLACTWPHVAGVEEGSAVTSLGHPLWVLPGCRGQDMAVASGRAEEYSTDSTPKPEALS